MRRVGHPRMSRRGALPAGALHNVHVSRPPWVGKARSGEERGMGQVLVGTSGWVYSDWAGKFYRDVPRTRWLCHYAEHFPTVEVNATFYRLPSLRAVGNWRQQVPAGFRFV